MAVCVLTSFLLVSTHFSPLSLTPTCLLWRPTPATIILKMSSLDFVHPRGGGAYRMGPPFTVIGKLEPLCVSRLIHLLTLVILDLKDTQTISVGSCPHAKVSLGKTLKPSCQSQVWINVEGCFRKGIWHEKKGRRRKKKLAFLVCGDNSIEQHICLS